MKPCPLNGVFALLLLFPLLTQAQEFPGRSVYPKLPVIETDELARDFDRYDIVDVRSNYEYETLHIDGATNIPLNQPGFARKLRKQAENGKPIVFYCNGHSCYKSYKATRKALRAGLDQVFAYDAGVFDWARTNPDRAVLLGRKPLDPARLISKEQLQQHLLSPEEFAQRARKDVEILDVRDATQRGLIEIFPFRQTNIALDETGKLNQFLQQVKESGKPLLVYDAAGKQVRWLQYRLEQAGIQDYWFMEGGMKNWFRKKEG
jgi:rhodanese-related sulfurtransferase